MPQIALCGVNHKTAPVSLRERLAITPSTREETLKRLLDRPSVNEAVVISTCNRVEVVLGGQKREEELRKEAEELFSTLSGASNTALRPHLYHYQGLEAVEHLFKVGCGLYWMILG
jgi:glutamyl-tRNA reductase